MASQRSRIGPEGDLAAAFRDGDARSMSEYRRTSPEHFQAPFDATQVDMPRHLQLEILPQPDDTTCGPTCLHAVYQYFDDLMPLEQLIRETPALTEGGTLAVLLGCHALRRGYRVTIYTFNLNVFDPSWFQDGVELIPRLDAQMKTKPSAKLQAASRAYIEFLRLGGRILMRELSAALIRRYLKRSIPILTGLSATYLYQCKREIAENSLPDDVRGVPTGHFVVLCGYDAKRRAVRVADPYLPNPLAEDHYYDVGLDRLVGAILLGVLTYDANLMVVEPGQPALHDDDEEGATELAGTE